MNSLKHFFLKLFQNVSAQEKINFARHLSVAIKSGLPLVESLILIRAQSSKRFARIIDAVVKDINNGQFLAESLRRFDYVFGDLFVNLVQVGEASGNLSSTLIYLAEELKKQKAIKSRIKGAMIYPIIILIATLGITFFLTFVIFPKILPVFSSLKVQLPLTTRIVIVSLKFLQNYGLQALGGAFLLVIALRAFLSVKTVHYYFDRLLLYFPVLSKLIVNITLANLTRSLGILLKSGMTIIDALTVSRGTFHNLHYRKEIDHIIESVRRGESISKHMERETTVFPAMLVGMVRVGETTGNLENNLQYLAEYYESEVDETLKNLTTILEPLLLLVMGLIVGFIALAMITPIYTITQGLKLK